MSYRTFVSREEKLMPGFRGQAHSLLGANIAGDCMLKPMRTDHSKSPGALQHYAKCTLLVPYKWNSKVCMTAPLFTIWLTEYSKPTAETYCLGKN